MATKLNRDYFLKYKTTLSERFYTEKEARSISTGTGLTLQVIEFSGKAIDIWSSVLTQAEVEEKLESLLRSAIAQSGDDKVLKGFLEEIVSGVALVSNLSGETETGENKFNAYLIETVVEKIRKYNSKLDDFLQSQPEWAKNEELKNNAEAYVISTFTDVVGIQLRKLIAIGKETYTADKSNEGLSEEIFLTDRMRKYLENCQLTAKRSLQLLCYTLLSKLWDYEPIDNGYLTEIQMEQLKKFFKKQAEPTIMEFVDLLRTLVTVFSEKTKEMNGLFFPELADIIINQDNDNYKSFSGACDSLDKISELLKVKNYKEDDRSEKEKCLAELLCHLGFLCRYKMISIKNISYSQKRKEPTGAYQLGYTRVDPSKTPKNPPYNPWLYKEPLTSTAVLIYEGDGDNLRGAVDLVPFVIDDKSKICFYSSFTSIDELVLKYSFIEGENNSKTEIKENSNSEIWKMFNDVKKGLTGLE